MSADNLIINALDDELQAVLQLSDGSSSSWARKSASSGFPYYLRSFSLPVETRCVLLLRGRKRREKRQRFRDVGGIKESLNLSLFVGDQSDQNT